MKRELKDIIVLNFIFLVKVSDAVPMKRELKVLILVHFAIISLSFRRCPYEEGTESSRCRKRSQAKNACFRRCPYEEGTERWSTVNVHSVWSPVSDAVPMKRELKVMKALLL